MTTVTDHNKTSAALILYHAVDHLNEAPRDYNDYKAAQLLGALADSLVAEARIAAWFMDLGFVGCQV